MIRKREVVGGGTMFLTWECESTYATHCTIWAGIDRGGRSNAGQRKCNIQRAFVTARSFGYDYGASTLLLSWYQKSTTSYSANGLRALIVIDLGVFPSSFIHFNAYSRASLPNPAVVRRPCFCRTFFLRICSRAYLCPLG